MQWKRYALAGIVVMFLTITQAIAHEGHDDIEALTGGAPAGGALELDKETIANLEIKSVPAELKPLPEILSMPALVTLIPERQALITTRFDGLIREIMVKLGEEVRKGQPLLAADPGLTLANDRRYTITTPIDGRVIQQNVVLGQPVAVQTVVMQIADMQEVLLRGALYETPDISRIKVGQTARALIPIYAGQVFEGSVEKIDAGPAPESHVFHVYARFRNAGELLKPNLRGNLEIELGGAEKPVVVVPASAVLENNGVFFLFVKDGNKFERREVRLGRKSANEVEIVSGIFPDEEAVTQGNYQLQYRICLQQSDDRGHRL